MRVLIIGSGVNGALVGAALVEGGAEVTFLTRPSRQRQLITTGLHITSPLGRFRKPVHAVAPSKRVGGPLDVKGAVDVLVVAARAHNYQMGLFAVRDVITPETLIVPTFDGVHHLSDWRERYPRNAVALAAVDVRATVDADGIVRQIAPMGLLRLGSRSVSAVEKISKLCDALVGRRFRAEQCGDDVLRHVWARAIFRAAAAGASRLAGIPLRDAIRFHSKKPFTAMLDEGVRTAEAHRVRGVREAVTRYRDGFLREGEPIQAPAPIEAGDRARAEARFLLGNMLRKAEDGKVDAQYLQRAWVGRVTADLGHPVAT